MNRKAQKEYNMKVLFICSANICRSALAEAILKKKLQQEGINGIEVESVGVHNYEGEPRDEVMVSYAHKAGYELGGAAKYVTQAITDTAEIIICMEHFHVVEMQKRVPYAQWNCIHTFNEICFNERTDLVDPSGDTCYMYHYVFEKIQEGCGILASKLNNMMNKAYNHETSYRKARACSYQEISG